MQLQNTLLAVNARFIQAFTACQLSSSEAEKKRLMSVMRACRKRRHVLKHRLSKMGVSYDD